MVDKEPDDAKVLKKLTNKEYYVAKGHIGIINLVDGAIEDRRRNEKILFQRRFSKYGQLDMRKVGTEFLSHTLHQHLSAHIKRHLPAVLGKLETKSAELSEKLSAYDQTGEEDKQKLISRLIKAVSDRFSEPLLGRRVLISKLMSGPRINDIYHTEFPKVLTPDKPNEAKLMRDIGVVQRNLASTSIQRHTRDEALDALVKDQLEAIRPRMSQCVGMVRDELTTTFQAVLDDDSVISRFPRFKDCLQRHVFAFIKNASEKTIEHLETFLACEQSLCNTHHKDFPNTTVEGKVKQAFDEARVKGPSWAAIGPRKMDEGTPEQKELADLKKGWIKALSGVEPVPADAAAATGRPIIDKPIDHWCLETRAELHSYMRIVSQSIIDVVPKSVQCLLVSEVVEFVRSDDLKDDVKDEFNQNKMLFIIRKEDQTTSDRLRKQLAGCAAALEVAKTMVVDIDVHQDSAEAEAEPSRTTASTSSSEALLHEEHAAPLQYERQQQQPAGPSGGSPARHTTTRPRRPAPDIERI